MALNPAPASFISEKMRMPLARTALVACLTVLPLVLMPLHAGRGTTLGDATVSEIVSVYDGDTFTGNIESWPAIVGREIPIRLAGVDTPEINSQDPHTKDLAHKARLYTRNRLLKAQIVTLRNVRRGKYFRVVADVYVDKWNLSKELIRVGLGKEYDGGTRPAW